MKIAVMLIAVAHALASGGCANQSPTQTALDAHAAYNVTMSGLIEARRAGLISDAAKVQIEKVRVPVYDAVLAIDAAAIADNSAGTLTALRQFRAVLPALQRVLLQYAKPPPAPLK